jgi:hypothetical protein
MYYVIANFYYIPSSLYAYCGLSSPSGREEQDARHPSGQAAQRRLSGTNGEPIRLKEDL